MDLIALFNKFSAIVILLTQVLIVILFLGLWLAKKRRLNKTGLKILNFFGQNGLLLAFLAALAGLIGSLIYSDVIGFPPCILCWYQRIFLYPQVILLGMAYFKKDKNIFDYSIALSVIGGLVALYNQYLQFGGSLFLPCGVDSNAVSCSIRYVFEFGYITIPMMSLTVFALLIVLAFLGKKTEEKGI